MLPIPKSRISSSWVKVKLTRQLEVSQSGPVTFPVTSTLKMSLIQFTAKVSVPSNSDYTCRLLLLMEREGPASSGVPYTGSIEDSIEKLRGGGCSGSLLATATSPSDARDK